MASATLSQNEIDSLLSRDTPLGSAAAAAVARADAQLYDFRRPHRVSKDRLRTLEAMYEQLVKALEGWLIGRVRGQVELRLQSVEQYTFGEFILSLPSPCSSYLFDIHESEQQGIIDFGGLFASFLVDRLFGGNGKMLTTPGRALTPIERMAVKVVAERVLTLLVEAWQDHIPLNLALSGFESMPEILGGSNRDEAALVATIEAVVGEHRSPLLICLPFSVLENFFSGSRDRRLSSGTMNREAAESREQAEASLRSTELGVSARLPEFQLPFRALASLRVGGVISTGIPIDAELEVRVADQPRFRATPGRVGRRLAISISDDLAGDFTASDPS